MTKAEEKRRKIEHVIAVVRGQGGNVSLYVDNYRVAGEKPWGSGHVLYTFECTAHDLFEAGVRVPR